MADNPKVFISYSHQSAEFEEKILNFSNKLRSEGIDANIDLYEEAPQEGWPRWMENQIRESDYVLVVCDKSYYDKFYSDNKGKGVIWEVNIVYQFLYDSYTETRKFIPVFLIRKMNNIYQHQLKDLPIITSGQRMDMINYIGD